MDQVVCLCSRLGNRVHLGRCASLAEPLFLGQLRRINAPAMCSTFCAAWPGFGDDGDGAQLLPMLPSLNCTVICGCSGSMPVVLSTKSTSIGCVGGSEAGMNDY